MAATDIIEDIRELTADIEKKLLLLRSPEFCKSTDHAKKIENADHELRRWYIKNLTAIVGDDNI
jgi:hypothetical protein